MWTTNRLSIELIHINHAEELFAALDFEDVGQYIGGPDLQNVEDARSRIEFVTDPLNVPIGQEWFNFIVNLDGKIIGRIEATLQGSHAEVAYVFGTPWWGQGYGVEATQWLLDFLVKKKVESAWATVDPRNASSIKLLMKLGFAKTEPPFPIQLLSFESGDFVFAKKL